jgi:regulator of replication initiation timing
VENFRLINTVNRLSDEVDSLTKDIYNLKQQQKDMLAQIKRLKGEQDDGK